MIFRFFVSLLFLTALAVAPSVQAQDILTLLKTKDERTEPPAPPQHFPYDYIVEYNTSEKSKKEVSTFFARYKVSPGAPAGTRVTILETSNETEDETENEDFITHIKELDNEDISAEEFADEVWCNSPDDDEDESDQEKLSELLSSDRVTVVSENDDQAVLEMKLLDALEVVDFDSSDIEFEGDEDGKTSGIAKKFFKRLNMKMTLSKPDAQVRGMHISLSKPMRVFVVAKIKEMNVNLQCGLAPNGFYYKAETSMQAKMSALGKKIEQTNHIKVVELIPTK